jgi:tRNA(His) 5'-end guanylyltransferase
MSLDALGDRMKMYEDYESDRRFFPLLPIVARLDGRGFSRFTKGMDRPFDLRMTRAMVNTTKYLVDHTNAIMGYTQSDEITLTWYSDSLKNQIWFDRRVAKMTSHLAAQATLFFYREVLKQMPGFADRLPTFDARACNFPTLEEATNNFLWRERDASKNSISMAASAFYSQAQLHKKSGAEMQDMLMAKGVNWNDFPSSFKRGTFIQRRVIAGLFSTEELDSLPQKHKARTDSNLQVARSRILELEMPIFDKVVNRVGVIFHGEDPIIGVPLDLK